MTPVRFILASLRHYRRIHVAVALGVAVAAAVLTGALLVGDSMRGSLRDLTIQRLGKIDSVLIAEQLFRAALAEELASEPGFKANFATGTSRLRASFETAEPALLLTGTLQTGSGKGVRRATRVSVVGIRPTFWELGQGGPAKPLADGQVALTESLATELGAQVNDEILLRLGTVGAIPADSPLGEKSETSTARPLEVAAVLPGDGLARFSLAPSQHLPRNVFLPLTTLQKILDQPGKANAILVSSQNANRPNDAWAVGALQGTLRPALEDYGLRIEPLPFRKTAVQISADQLVLRPEVVSAMAEFSRDEIQPVVTYLANSIAIGEGESQRKIPYSTITGIHPTSTLGPLRDEGGEPIVLAEDEIVLNQWAAADLKAKVGDLVSVTYYEPESVHGKLRERKTQPLKLRAIVPLEDAAGNPSPAADSMLTPELPGVTDKESIDEWDLPFELVEKIRPQDEEYWDKYHTTPKAFISPHAAARLWKSRWGTTSLVRIDLSKTLHLTDQSAVEWAESRLREELVPSHMGMRFMPVKAQGLAASQGTTPFDWLFLGFSFFLMASAVMLIAILFQLGVEQRARELGTLAAVGVGRRSITRLLGREGLVVAAIGAALGVAIGILYAWL
ncbi:MAG TPA: ABC transporter permease, partial [Lacipirellulaceae bacterium]